MDVKLDTPLESGIQPSQLRSFGLMPVLRIPEVKVSNIMSSQLLAHQLAELQEYVTNCVKYIDPRNDQDIIAAAILGIKNRLYNIQQCITIISAENAAVATTIATSLQPIAKDLNDYIQKIEILSAQLPRERKRSPAEEQAQPELRQLLTSEIAPVIAPKLKVDVALSQFIKTDPILSTIKARITKTNYDINAIDAKVHKKSNSEPVAVKRSLFASFFQRQSSRANLDVARTKLIATRDELKQQAASIDSYQALVSKLEKDLETLEFFLAASDPKYLATQQEMAYSFLESYAKLISKLQHSRSLCDNRFAIFLEAQLQPAISNLHQFIAMAPLRSVISRPHDNLSLEFEKIIASHFIPRFSGLGGIDLKSQHGDKDTYKYDFFKKLYANKRNIIETVIKEAKNSPAEVHDRLLQLMENEQQPEPSDSIQLLPDAFSIPVVTTEDLVDAFAPQIEIKPKHATHEFAPTLPPHIDNYLRTEELFIPAHSATIVRAQELLKTHHEPQELTTILDKVSTDLKQLHHTRDTLQLIVISNVTTPAQAALATKLINDADRIISRYTSIEAQLKTAGDEKTEEEIKQRQAKAGA